RNADRGGATPLPARRCRPLGHRTRRPPGHARRAAAQCAARGRVTTPPGRSERPVEGTMDTTETLDDQLARPASERKSHERDRRLLDTMPQCIWAADAEGRVNYWNRAGLEYCGLDAAQLTDGSFWEVLHADDRDEARVHWERGLRGEPTFERQV